MKKPAQEAGWDFRVVPCVGKSLQISPMGILGFGRKAPSTAAVIQGQGLVDMDRTLLAYYQEWMEGGGDISAEQIDADLDEKARNLASPDPNYALNYRMVLNQELARRWPVDLGQRFANEMGRHWAPNAESDAYWESLPSSVRRSYTGQGQLMFQAFVQGISGEATAD